jgi:conserved phage protein
MKNTNSVRREVDNISKNEEYKVWVKNNKEFIKLKAINYDTQTVDTAEYGILNFNDVNISKYIKRNDIRGNKIFTGDIIKAKGYITLALGTLDLEIRGYVTTYKGYWIIKDVKTENVFYLKDFEEIEIIGNVWENKEFLK